MFDRLVWHPHYVLLDDLVFVFEDVAGGQQGGADCFVLHKVKWILDEYADFLSRKKDFSPRNVLEIGIWDGGSIALWFEHFQPQKLVAVDLSTRGDSPYFQRYLQSGGRAGRIKTYWGTDQADSVRLREIVASEFEGPLDLVIDDGSHLYGPTKASFETLFPLLRPGGLYVIEDWSWGCWACNQAPGHPWSTQTPLSKLIAEIVELTGPQERLNDFSELWTLLKLRKLVARLHVSSDLVIVERGDVPTGELGPFKLEQYLPQHRANPGPNQN